jgi:hypothetical protein
VPDTEGEPRSGAAYALRVADESYDWYRSRAIRTRSYHRWAEALLVLVSAAVPVSGLVAPGRAAVPAVLGTLVVIIVGLKGVFHWQEDYLRFSQAREAVERERRLFRTGASPYDSEEGRAQTLVEAVSRIEQQEMGNWLRMMSARPATGRTATDASLGDDGAAG